MILKRRKEEVCECKAAAECCDLNKLCSNSAFGVQHETPVYIFFMTNFLMIFDGAAKYFFIEYLVSAIRKILAEQMFDVSRHEKIPKLRQQQGRACLILGMRGKCER